MFNTILIANRGEIACRVIAPRAARDADRGRLFRRRREREACCDGR
jgi:hypothetical protein